MSAGHRASGTWSQPDEYRFVLADRQSGVIIHLWLGNEFCEHRTTGVGDARRDGPERESHEVASPDVIFLLHVISLARLTELSNVQFQFKRPYHFLFGV
jgi:hypothetical protein